MIKYRYQKLSALILLLYFQIGFSQNKGLFKNHYLPCEGMQINCMVEDSEKMIWIGTENGLIQLNPIQRKLDCISEIREGVGHIIVDEMNNKWLVGLRGTVYKINQDNIVLKPNWFFSKYLTTYQKITSVFERNQELWMGTSDGFIIYLNTLGDKIDTIGTPVNNAIHSTYVDVDKQIFIGTDEGMLYQNNPKGDWLSEDEISLSLGANYGNNIPFSRLATNHLDEIEGIYKIASIDDDLWVLGKSKSSDEFRLMNWTDNYWNQYSIDCMTALPQHIRLDGEGNIWFNNQDEVVKYNLSTGKCTLIVSQRESSSMNMSNVIADNDGTLWIGSLKKGLCSKELKNPLPLSTTSNDKPETPRIPPEKNLVFLLDISSSMRTPKKWGVLKGAMISSIKELDIKDEVSIVTYSRDAEIVLFPTPINNNNKPTIHNAIEDLPKPKGNTNIFLGVKKAWDIANSFFHEEKNKIVLITDGEDIAEKNIEKIIKLIRSHKNKFIHLSILYFDEEENHVITNKFNGLDRLKNANFRYTRGDRLKKVLFEIIND